MILFRIRSIFYVLHLTTLSVVNQVPFRSIGYIMNKTISITQTNTGIVNGSGYRSYFAAAVCHNPENNSFPFVP